jgi:acetoin utilization deacetylase AcuC-like enzyme
MVDRSRRSVGATLAAARAALEEGVAANLAGGTHHASAARGSGYCVFNDVAVASRRLQAEAPLRIAVVDLDVHQGDGTAAIFAGDDSVFTLSLHGAKNFPFRKAASDLDVALPDGCADAEYLDALERALGVLWHEHATRPFGLAFYLAGADPHEGDRLGRLKLSAAGLLERDRRVLAGLGARRIPVALAMAGGYGHDLEVTVSIQAATIDAAIHAWRRWAEAAAEPEVRRVGGDAPPSAGRDLRRAVAVAVDNR